MIYEHKTSMVLSGGSANTFTLKVIHGLLRNVYVRANSSTTVFRFNLQDEDGEQRIDYGFSTGIINDNSIAFPIVGRYKGSITNANPTQDTFKIILGVEE